MISWYESLVGYTFRMGDTKRKCMYVIILKDNMLLKEKKNRHRVYILTPENRHITSHTQKLRKFYGLFVLHRGVLLSAAHWAVNGNSSRDELRLSGLSAQNISTLCTLNKSWTLSVRLWLCCVRLPWASQRFHHSPDSCLHQRLSTSIHPCEKCS